MKLKLMTPLRVEVDEAVTKVSAEGLHGVFSILPRHVDIAAALVPGLLRYESEGGQEAVLGVDGGLLVKCGDEVLVSTPAVVRGGELGSLEQAVEEAFEQLDEEEQRAQHALQRLEADIVRRVVEVEEDARR